MSRLVIMAHGSRLTAHGSRLTAHGYNCVQLTYPIFHLFTFILVFALTFFAGIPAFAANSAEYVRRYYSNGNVEEKTLTVSSYEKVVSTSTKWDSKWYYAYGNVIINSKVTVSGDVNLILKDEATLTAKKGIYVPEGSSLTIYGQEKNTGKLIATGEGGQAGIGGQSGAYGATIIIHGGSFDVTGGGGAAGIGGYGLARITIYGGTITATGGNNAAGIGGSISSLQTTITIYGGNITATGGQNGAGIWSGLNKGLTTCDAGTISIYGGNITATAGKNVESDTALNYDPKYYTAGIGGGNRFENCTVNIYGGNITANCYRGSFTSMYMGIGGTNRYGIGYGIRGQATLSYSKPTDSIYATNYGGTVTIADGKTFRADGTEISGAVESVTVSETVSTVNNTSGVETIKYPTFPAIDNKTLTPPNVYTVNIGTEGIIASSAQAFPNETVTLTPAAGYNLTDIKVDGTAITGNTFTMPEHDVTVTGTLTPITYTITYELNGGTATNPTTYTVETKTFTLNNPTKSGYTFDGWGNVHAETITIKKGSTGDRSYTANWVISYTVKFNANGGTGEMSSQGFTYDTAQAITGNTFTREGYTFKGWNTESDGSGTSYTDGQEVSNLTGEAGGEVTLYAQWEISTYTITYSGIDGATFTANNPASYTIEDAITLTNPTKDGYSYLKHINISMQQVLQYKTAGVLHTSIKSAIFLHS